MNRDNTGKDGVVITVKDTGIGMSASELSQIFGRFFQGNSTPEIMNQGSGIGLSIANEFVRLHSGFIDVHSIQGKGSEFIISLPLEELKAIELENKKANFIVNTEPELPGVDSSAQLSDEDYLRVLLVEDNDDFRTYLRDQLKPFYKVIEAQDGKSGWQKALSAHPHVIISDINMPNMDGISLSNKLKADNRTSHIPIILLTAMAADSDQLAGLKTGANDYLTKPFSGDILRLKIRNLLLLSHKLKETYTRRLQIDSAAAPEMQSENDLFLLKVAAYVESKLDDDQLSVEQMSKDLFMSRVTLYKKIVDLTGETPIEFIRSVRLNKAALLLENSDMRIAEISYAVGFTTPNYFTRAFKMKFNLSPKEYMSKKRKT